MHTRFDMIHYSCYSTTTIVSGGPRLGVAPRKASSVAAEPGFAGASSPFSNDRRWLR